MKSRLLKKYIQTSINNIIIHLGNQIMSSTTELHVKLKTLIVKPDNKTYEPRKWKLHKDLRNQIVEMDIPEFYTIQEKIWALWFNIYERPKCECGKSTGFLSHYSGFREFCSTKCLSNSPKTKAKTKATEEKHYPEGHHTRSKQFQQSIYDKYGYWPGSFSTDAFKNAIKEKYGVDNVFQSGEIKEKIKQTNLNNHGYSNPQQVPEIRERTRNTKIEKYGRDGWNPEQVILTMQEKYGVDNPLQSQIIRDKIKNNCLVKYGVEHPMQNPEIFERCQQAQQRAAYKYKKMILPSGKEMWYQGYEKFVIEYLLKCDIQEDDITNLRSELPKITYKFEGKNKRYFPDLLVKSKKMIIEVKSTYTYSREADKNLAKQEATKRLGYNHIIIIWDAKTDSIFKII